MMATNHVLTGSLIAASIQNPWIALPLALASHFVLDGIPHFGSSNIKYESSFFKRLLYSDMFLAALVLIGLLLLWPDHALVIVAGGVLGASPDLMWVSKYLAALRHKKPATPGIIRRFHSSIQWFERPIGTVVEVAWFVAMLLLINAQLLIIH